MALKRRIKKLTKSEIRKIGGRQYLICSECGEEEVEVPSDIGRVTCAYCVQKMIAPPAGYRKESTSETPKPRGWHFKEYFEHEGKIYSKGKEITDPEEIATLKKATKKTKTVVKETKITKPKKVSKSKVTKTTVKRGRKNARTAK